MVLIPSTISRPGHQFITVRTRRQWRFCGRMTGGAVGYLQTAVVNACRSVQRHQVVVDRHRAREAGAADLPGRLSQESAETQVLHAAERGAMIEALRGLPPRQREVLVLRYYADLSEAQIAEALGIAPGSVKAHAHRGLSSLRQVVSLRGPQQSPNPEVDQS